MFGWNMIGQKLSGYGEYGSCQDGKFLAPKFVLKVVHLSVFHRKCRNVVKLRTLFGPVLQGPHVFQKQKRKDFDVTFILAPVQ